MKRLLSLSAVLALLWLLCACGKTQPEALVIDGVSVSKGVYAYYLDRAFAAAEDEATDDALHERAIAKCAEFAALQTLMHKEGVTLSVPYKSQAATQTEGQWQFFGGYYKRLGMQKPDMTQVQSFEAGKAQMVQYDYGEGGEHAVSQKRLQKLFDARYVGFRAFSGSLTKTNAKGENVALSKEETKAVTQAFDTLLQRANSGDSFDTLYKDYCRSQGLLVTGTPEVTLIKDGDAMYPDGFFRQVQALRINGFAVLRGESALYFVQRADILAADSGYFAQYAADVLQAEKMPALEKKLAAQAADCEIAEDTAQLREAFNRVKSVRQSEATSSSR